MFKLGVLLIGQTPRLDYEKLFSSCIPRDGKYS